MSLISTPATSHQISRLLKQQANIDTVFQKGKTIQNVLKANGKPTTTDREDPSGAVYHVKCDCGDTYVGETSRPLPVRMKEHQTSVKKQDSKSAISDHIKAHPNHNILWNDINVITCNHSNYKIRKLLEAIHIKRLQPAIDRDQGYYISTAYHNLITDES